MTKHHGWCHTGCQPGPHSWWPDSVWQVQSRLPDKAPQTSCPMSCCQSDYAVSACHRLVTKHDVKKLTPLSDRAWLTWEIANFNVRYKQTFCFPSHWSWWTLGQCGVNTVLWDPPGLGGWVNHVSVALVAAGAAKTYSIPAAPCCDSVSAKASENKYMQFAFCMSYWIFLYHPRIC